MTSRIRDEVDEAGRARVLANGMDDLRAEMLERFSDVLGDLASLRALFKWVIGIVAVLVASLIVLSIQLAAG